MEGVAVVVEVGFGLFSYMKLGGLIRAGPRCFESSSTSSWRGKVSHVVKRWRSVKVHKQWKKCPWLFRVDRGWNTTQVYRDYNEPWNKDPSWTTLMEVSIRPFFFVAILWIAGWLPPKIFPIKSVGAPFFLVGRIFEVNRRQSARTWILFTENKFWSIKENLHLSMYCIYLSILSI